jgi:transposase
MSTMARKRRTKHTREFKEEAIRLVNLGDQPIAGVARELGISSKTLWQWVHQAEIDAGKGPPEALTTTERQELGRLRRDVAVLREEREILKKATAFFAKESK